MKKLFAKLLKKQGIIIPKQYDFETASKAMQERIAAGIRRRQNAQAPATLAEPDLSFKDDVEIDHPLWRDK
tara:strand:- start:384 stop:596 length:213 start_codon:yes stop_codon:yes gene_type:complete